MLKVNKEELSYTFDYNKKPILRIPENTSFTIVTEDNVSGLIKTERDLPTPENLSPFSKSFPARNNPVTGPVFVEGAKKGDVLAVNIEKIIPDDHGITYIKPGNGLLRNYSSWPEINKAFTKILKHIPGPSGTMRDGMGIFNENIIYDLKPFIGTIGVCPEFEILSTLTCQFTCCGNWDCRDIKENSKVFLNCYHDGGLLYIGDVHASQGDTEVTWTADETRSEVTVNCNVVKNKNIPYARIEKKESIIQIYADSPMELAVQNAIYWLIEWVVRDYGFEPRDIYLLLSVIPDFRINIYQMAVHPMFKPVVGAELPKKYLSGGNK
jgi:amidase